MSQNGFIFPKFRGEPVNIKKNLFKPPSTSSFCKKKTDNNTVEPN